MNKESMDSCETLIELLIGIVCFGAAACGIGLCFVSDRAAYAKGLWIGSLIALLAACHMWWGLNRGMDLGDGATKYLLSQNMLRYGVIVVIFVVLCITEIGSPLAAFLGIMGLKAGAYLQPLTHKILKKLRRR